MIIGNHEINLKFDMPTWEKFEDKIGLIDDFEGIVSGKGRLRKIAMMVAIMNEDQPCSAEHIFSEMEPPDVRMAVREIRRTISAALKMQTEKGEDKVVDEVLEEIEKKETGAD